MRRCRAVSSAAVTSGKLLTTGATDLTSDVAARARAAPRLRVLGEAASDAILWGWCWRLARSSVDTSVLPGRL
ncbi:hypothetical protein Asi02nite_81540 [Asanoa siamensis]|uniref:Uncharacterized protein n=1 Tax=Asanoa siamensis TaxID=926357 RepID=A0ABQ4D545_9ACTN|nr:hypothetical protein Asi02nite_81540 [Asanoa siamensis]